MTNEQLELHNTLIAILMELQKINKHLDKMLDEKPVKIATQEYNLHPPYTIT